MKMVSLYLKERKKKNWYFSFSLSNSVFDSKINWNSPNEKENGAVLIFQNWVF